MDLISGVALAWPLAVVLGMTMLSRAANAKCEMPMPSNVGVPTHVAIELTPAAGRSGTGVAVCAGAAGVMAGLFGWSVASSEEVADKPHAVGLLAEGPADGSVADMSGSCIVLREPLAGTT